MNIPIEATSQRGLGRSLHLQQRGVPVAEVAGPRARHRDLAAGGLAAGQRRGLQPLRLVRGTRRLGGGSRRRDWSGRWCRPSEKNDSMYGILYESRCVYTEFIRFFLHIYIYIYDVCICSFDEWHVFLLNEMGVLDVWSSQWETCRWSGVLTLDSKWIVSVASSPNLRWLCINVFGVETHLDFKCFHRCF